MLQSGQGFMVQLSSGSSNASVQFQENDKDSSEINVTGKQAGSPYPVIYTNLMTPYNGSLALTDGVAAGFANKFSAAVDGDDAIKLWNFSENIALVRGNYTLAIEFRPVPKLTDTLFYRLYLKQQPYTLQIFSQNLVTNITGKAWLVDKYLGKKTVVILSDTTLYNFNPNADTNSYRNRFMLVFDRGFTATPVPVTKALSQANPDVTGIANNALAKTGITVYPNPVAIKDKAMLQFNNMDKGSYTITVFNTMGQKLVERIIQHSGRSAGYSLSLNPSWAAGVYTISATNENLKRTMNFQLVINK